MHTIPASSKKLLFNKEADEALTEDETEAWNAFLAWEAYNEGTGNYYDPDLIKGMPSTPIPEIKNDQDRKKNLVEKIDFDNPLFIKAAQAQFIIETINEEAWQELNKMIASDNETAPTTEPEQVTTELPHNRQPEEVATQQKRLTRLPIWMRIAAAALIVLIPAALILRHHQKTAQPKLLTVTTTYGEIRTITLSDGSTIWLNALSTITYPETFTGNERHVNLVEGEARFVEQSDPLNRFIVHAGKTVITATGTDFNVKAFAEESKVVASLKTGMLKVKNGNDSVNLVPGEQAIVSGGRITKKDSVNFRNVLAWQQKDIVLEGESLTSVMRQIDRYYHVNFQVVGDLPPIHLSGQLKTKHTKEDVITLLNRVSGKTRFKLQNDTVIVYQGVK